jgi:MFS family permease
MNKRQSRISLDKIILIIGLIIYGAGFSLLYIIFAPLSRSIGLSTNQFGILIAISNVTLVFSSFYWGKKSQSMGRKPVFIIGLFSYALAYALFAFGIQLGLWGLFATWQLFSILFVIRLIYGGLIGGIQPAAVAYISDSTEGEHRTQGMALIGMSSGIGTMIGPAVGGGLAFVHPLFPLYFGAALAIIGGLLAMKFLIEPNQRLQTRPVQNHNLKFYDKRIMPYLIGWAVAFLVFTGTQVIAAFFIEDRLGVTGYNEIIKATSIALLSMALATTLMQAVVLQIINIPARILLRLCFLIFGFVLFSIPHIETLNYYYLSFAGIGVAFSMITPGLNSAATLSVEEHEQGEVAGLLSAAPVVGMIFGPVIGALLYNINPNYPFFFGSLAVIVLGIYFQFVKTPDS